MLPGSSWRTTGTADDSLAFHYTGEYEQLIKNSKVIILITSFIEGAAS
jgi:hypothetical protein